MRLFRVSKIGGEIRSDQLFSRCTGNSYRSLVYIGDLPFRIYGYQRVKARLYERAGIDGSLTEHTLGLFQLGEIYVDAEQLGFTTRSHDHRMA